MKVSEAIAIFKELLDVPEQMLFKYSAVTTEEQKTALIRVRKAEDMAIKSLEMQDKLKQWVENYKNPEFKDVMITRDGLIDILEEFRLECEKPMKEVTVVMNVQVTRILKNVPNCFGMDEEALKKQTISEIKAAGYDDVLVEDMKVFEGGAE